MDAEETQDVRLEFAAAVEMDAPRVVRFVYELPGVPSGAWCDVRDVWHAQLATPKTAPVRTTVQLSCKRRVAEVLCQRFPAQTRHVSQGELLLVRCQRVWMRSLPTTVSKSRVKRDHSSLPSAKQKAPCNDKGVETQGVGTQSHRPAAISRSTMVDLLDCLGDQIANVLEAFQAYAEPFEDEKRRLTVIGLVQALAMLSAPGSKIVIKHNAPSARSDPKPLKAGHSRGCKEEKDTTVDRLAVQKIRHLISQLIAHKAVALSALPEKNDVPFMVYTDFISCYVAYMGSTSSNVSKIERQ